MEHRREIDASGVGRSGRVLSTGRSWVQVILGEAIRLLPVLCVVAAFGAETGGQTNKPAQTSAIDLRKEVRSFRIEPGFRVALAATAPMVTAPVAAAFDENGRLYVVEAPGRSGRVRLLEDMGSDGMFQTDTVFADDLAQPSAIACYAGGVFVAAGSEIIYLKASKGQGAADIRKVVLAGFGGGTAPKAPAVLNSFNWGPDDRIHGATAGIGGSITASNWPSGVVTLAGSDFAFDPRSLEVFAESGPSQSGLSFDAEGRRFTSDLARPLRQPMYEARYALRNPFYVAPRAMVDVASPATRIFRFVTARIETPRSGLSNPGDPAGSAPGEANLLAPTWLTNAQGCLVYRGSAFPTNYLGNVFVADPSAHVVHRFVLRAQGLEAVAETPTGRSPAEFLVSSDASFRPVQILGGPDGAVYILDKQQQETDGRIYRVAPASFKASKLPEIGKARTYDLVAALAGNDGWHCDTAARLLYERRDPATIGLLTNMLNNSRLPMARLRALRSLGGLGALAEAHVLKGLDDADARVRTAAVGLSEQLAANGVISDVLWGRLRTLADDPSLAVRYQLAFTAGAFVRPDKASVLAQILRRDFGNGWIRNAVLSSLPQGAGELLVLLGADAAFRSDPAGDEFLRQLATMIGAQGRVDEVRQAVRFLTQTPLDRLQAFGWLAALGEGLRSTRSSLVMANPQAGLDRVFSAAMETAIDGTSPPGARVEAIRLIGVSPYTFADASDWLLILCNPQSPPEVRSMAIATVACYDDPGAVAGLLDRWGTFPGGLRNQAVASLLGRRSHAGLVLDALERGRILATDLSSTQRDFLRTYSDPAISARAIRLLGPVPVHRPEALDLFKPALRLTGFRDQGRAIFLARCASCHRLDGAGTDFGPNLAEARTQGKEPVLNAILEPNTEIKSEYATRLVETMEGGYLAGVESEDTPASVTLRQPGGGGVVCPRPNVSSVQTQNWSLMPTGLEQGLSTQDMADLLEYLTIPPNSAAGSY